MTTLAAPSGRFSRAPDALLDRIPAATLEWLLCEDNPAVAVLTRRTLLGLPDDEAATAMWARRNTYPPVAAILDAMREDGSWDIPSRDYQKYRGSLWQIHVLGEMWADGSDSRLLPAFDYAFSRQLEDGSWSATNARAAGSITCLTANVGRALARMGFKRDERVVAALGYCVDMYRALGVIDCREGRAYQLNGYCHMLTPKVLMLIGAVPDDVWPDGTTELRDECISRLREKQVSRCLPEEAREFNDAIWSMKAAERPAFRERFVREHPQLHYKHKPGWLRFGYPLSYNSDVLEALWALAAAGAPVHTEFTDAIDLIRASGDDQMRWTLRNSFNGKMFSDIETKGQPSKWLTLHALQVLGWAESGPSAVPAP